MKKMADKLFIIPLGGIGEIGKNMFAINYDQDIIILDAGLMFPEEEMLGVDIVIPDITYLLEHKDKIKAIFLSHGHEDHIGGLPYILPKINVPVYGTKLTLGLLKIKLEEFGLLQETTLIEIKSDDVIEIGRIKISFFTTNHSIPDSVGIVLNTPVGNVVYTSDFKFDHTPVQGKNTDFDSLARIGKEGVLVALSDSTNAERPGYTRSEKELGEKLIDIFCSAEGRIITVTFASNVHRIQQIVNAAVFSGRKLVVDGWSMVNVVEISQKLGYLNIPKGLLLDIDEVNKVPKRQVAILTTGTQGEPMSALARLATANHRKLEIIPQDTVVIAATPIPGNEKLVSRTIDNLFRRGAEVVYDAVSGIHVSGHASQEELKLMLSLLRPRYLIPVHGEFRHLIHHAELAQKLGMDKENIFIVENGTVLEFTPTSGRIAATVQAGGVFVDGLGVGDVGNIVLRDRKVLSRDGIFIIVMIIDTKGKRIVSGPDIVSRGFVYVKESEELLEEAKENVSFVLDTLLQKKISDWPTIKNTIKDSVGKLLWEKTGRKPMILPIIMEV
ncbi:MAG TPA: ribonuclease J [Firmicutes bacterium]|jgi:ribonuclease J|nr:ribonuclease J [Bacillota bacterium]